MGDQEAQMRQTFKYFVKLSNAGKTLTAAQMNEITDKGMNKMLKECCNDAVAKTADAQVFRANWDKTSKKVTVDVFVGKFLTDLAIVLVQNARQKKDPKAKRPEASDPDVVSKLGTLKEQIAAKHGAETKAKATDATTQRLTDVKSYTGAHKNRFDADGKGKGIEGREDRADNSGYVKGYKNEGTYDGACGGN